MHRCSRIYFLFGLSLLSLVISVQSFYEALSVGRTDHALCDIPRMIQSKETEIGLPIATACPAFSKEEVNFNKRSFGKMCLFVRDLYEDSQDPADVEYEICEKPYEMSVLYHKKSKEFHYGYEIYYDKKRSSMFSPINNGEYDSVMNANSWYSLLVPSHIFVNPKIFLENKTELGFMMMINFKITYDFKLNRLAQIKYETSRIHYVPKQCNNFDLGKEFYNGLNIDDLYKEENQKKIFQNILVPTTEIHDGNEEALCESETKCLMKWQLVPTNKLYFKNINSLSCSNLATVPIWKSIAEKLLQKLDIFLESLSKVANGNLLIHSGVHGILTIRSNVCCWRNHTVDIKLNGKDMAVPNVIYKIVEYHVRIKRDVPEGTAWFIDDIATIVVIHNNPYFTDEDEICPENHCEEWSWEEILYKDYPRKERKSRYIYCCPQNPETMRKLGLKFDQTLTGMDLKTFPILNEQGELVHEDITDPVKKIFKELFERKDVSHEDDESSPEDGERRSVYEKLETEGGSEDVSDSNKLTISVEK